MKRTGNSYRTQSEAVKKLMDLGMIEQKVVIHNEAISKIYHVTDRGKRFVQNFKRMRDMIEIGSGLKN